MIQTINKKVVNQWNNELTYETSESRNILQILTIERPFPAVAADRFVTSSRPAGRVLHQRVTHQILVTLDQAVPVGQQWRPVLATAGWHPARQVAIQIRHAVNIKRKQ